jgi:hypothetical protein
MPKTPIDFNKTIIYKLVCLDILETGTTETFVGYTTDFTTRKSKHKRNCNDENSTSYNEKIYQTIREKGGWDNWTMVLVEKYPCKNGKEARKKVKYWYAILNSHYKISLCKTSTN